MIYRSYYQSPLGEIVILVSKKGLCGLYFVGQKYFQYGFDQASITDQELPYHQMVTTWLTHYFEGKMPENSQLTYDWHGTEFQKRVWEELAEIPYGETLTYGQLAEQLSCKSAQAIGSAVGKNPISIIIPCHRVLGAKGQLTGYAGGLDRKRYLLELEKNHDFL